MQFDLHFSTGLVQPPSIVNDPLIWPTICLAETWHAPQACHDIGNHHFLKFYTSNFCGVSNNVFSHDYGSKLGAGFIFLEIFTPNLGEMIQFEN